MAHHRIASKVNEREMNLGDFIEGEKTKDIARLETLYLNKELLTRLG